MAEKKQEMTMESLREQMQAMLAEARAEAAALVENARAEAARIAAEARGVPPSRPLSRKTAATTRPTAATPMPAKRAMGFLFLVPVLPPVDRAEVVCLERFALPPFLPVLPGMGLPHWGQIGWVLSMSTYPQFKH